MRIPLASFGHFHIFHKKAFAYNITNLYHTYHEHYLLQRIQRCMQTLCAISEFHKLAQLCANAFIIAIIVNYLFLHSTVVIQNKQNIVSIFVA